MPMNQAYDRLYSDKVSKFAIFGPISNFARSLQATPLKYQKVTVTCNCYICVNYPICQALRNMWKVFQSIFLFA